MVVAPSWLLLVNVISKATILRAGISGGTRRYDGRRRAAAMSAESDVMNGLAPIYFSNHRHLRHVTLNAHILARLKWRRHHDYLRIWRRHFYRNK